MKMEYDYALFKNGDRVYAFGATIGLGPEGEIRYGWDGEVGDIGDVSLTPETTVELCEHMVAAWRDRLKKARTDLRTSAQVAHRK